MVQWLRIVRAQSAKCKAQSDGDVMKKKLTFNSLALGNLKHRKKQYTLLIIGIILSMVFSASVPFLISSSLSSAEATRKHLYGEEDIIIPDVTDNQRAVEALEKSYRTVGYASVFGYLFNPDAEEGNGFCFANFDDASKGMYVALKEGKLPEAKTEIAIEEEALVRMGLDAKVGETLTLDMYVKKGEELSESSQKTEFTLVGILENKRPNIEKHTILDYYAIPAAVVSDDYVIAPGGKASTMAFVSTGAFLNQKEYNEQFSAFLENYGEGNAHVLQFEISGFVKWDLLDSFSGITSPVVLLAVLSFVFMLVADIGIINAFSANLKERKKQIGLLRSVGATRRQIIKIYGRESFILCLICAPVSVLISLGIVSAIVPFFGENYVFEPEWWIIPVSIVLSIIFVLIASFVPLVSASRISPMQAIRNTELGRKFKNKKIKTQKDFDTSKLLAKRNITLFRGKGVITSIIVCISVVISCLGFSVVNGLKDDFDVYDHDYVVTAENFHATGFLSNYKTDYRGLNENNLTEILLNSNVENVSTQKITKGYIQREDFSEYMHHLCYYTNHYIGQPENVWVTKDNYKEYTRSGDAEESFVRECAQLQGNLVPVEIIAFDEEFIKGLGEYVVEGKVDIDIDKLNSGEEVILNVPEELMLTASHLEETGKYSFISTYETTIEESPDLATEDVFLDESTCDIKKGDKLKLGWLSAEEQPEFDYDIYHLAKDQQPIEYEKIENDVTVGSVIHKIWSYNDGGSLLDNMFYGSVRIITTIEGFDKLTGGNVEYHAFGVDLNTECTEEIDNDMQTLFKRVGAGANGSVTSFYEKRQEQENSMRATLIVIIAVAALFFTACGSMVNNSITARIRESKREIGTLRAVGATQKDINSSYLRQILSILGWGTVSGFVVFFALYGLYYLIFTSIGDTPDDVKITLIETIAGVLLLFISCTINMASKIRKEMKNSIVENIREL